MKKERVVLPADPNDAEDFDVTTEALERAMTAVLDAYNAKGYLTTEPFFSPGELAKISSLLDMVCEKAACDPAMAEFCVFERDQPREKRGGAAVEADDNRLFIVGDLPRFCPDVVPFIINPKLVQLVSALLGTSEIVGPSWNVRNRDALCQPDHEIRPCREWHKLASGLPEHIHLPCRARHGADNDLRGRHDGRNRRHAVLARFAEYARCASGDS